MKFSSSLILGRLHRRSSLGLLWLGVALACALPSSQASAAERKHSDLSAWQRSVVTVEVARKQYDYYQPWSKRTSRLQKSGLVLAGRQLLTTADELFDRTLVRVQKNGRGRWFPGEVAWVDYHANLALVTVADAEFWKNLKPATLGGPMPADGTLQILRWRDGNLESRHAEFTRFSVREGQLSAVNHVVLEADSDISGAGWGEPVVANSHVVGILTAHENKNSLALPASFVKSILEARSKGNYHGLGFFHFFWQPAENPASLARLKLPGEPRGVLITEVPDRPDSEPQVLKPKDVLLRIDDFELDVQGDYEDPEFGSLLLENLATRKKWAGDTLKLQVWRDGKMLDVNYRLPRFEYTNNLVPAAFYDQEPEYLVLGGLVFQPLTDSFLQSWGNEWKRRSPFRLAYYRSQPRSEDRTGLVMLTQVLPDPYNIGYQEQKFLVLDQVNGRKISRMRDLCEALKHPVKGFHVLEFVQSDSLRRVVVEDGPAEKEATERVLKRYGISEASHLAEHP